MAKPNAIPTPRNYRVTNIFNTELPFIASPRFFSKKGGPHCGKLWHVPRTGDYDHARVVGSLYAAHFAQYLADNPVTVGHNLLGRIATDMDFHDASARRGYWIGFFSFLEHLICTQAVQRPVFGDLQHFRACMTMQHDWPVNR